ncbi:MAG: hypothetical protein ABW208_18820 [Pyrinomonadaceae bacterium]
MLSPLNSRPDGARRRACAPPRFGVAACAALLLALTFAVRAAAADGERALSDGDVRRAEKVLAKLRLLHEAADAGDAGAYRTLASKLYPDLFVKVAELQPGDVSTDLSTAVFLAEQLGRTWSAAGAQAAVCTGERPDTYLPLCLNLRGGSARQLLLAKSRLHARWAEALLKNGRGAADAETAHSLAEVRAARANDQLIAAHIVETLRLLEAPPTPSPAVAGIRERFDASASGAGADNAKFAEALREAGVLLTWLPRSPTFYHLLSARQAYADGLWWHGKARQAKSLVISAKNFAPDPLKDLRLNAEQVTATARANWMSATKHTRLAELSLSQPAR